MPYVYPPINHGHVGDKHRVDITIDQGKDLYVPLAFRVQDGTLVDFTSWTAVFRIYRAPAVAESLHSLTPVLTGDHADGTVMLGEFGDPSFEYNCLLTILAARSSDLDPWGVGTYNLDLIDDFGRVRFRVTGTAVLEEGNRNA